MASSRWRASSQAYQLRVQLRTQRAAAEFLTKGDDVKIVGIVLPGSDNLLSPPNHDKHVD